MNAKHKMGKLTLIYTFCIYNNLLLHTVIININKYIHFYFNSCKKARTYMREYFLNLLILECLVTYNQKAYYSVNK